MAEAKDSEVEAMSKLVSALDGLDPAVQARALRWAADRYGLTLGGRGSAVAGRGDGSGSGADLADYKEVGDLVAAAAPSTDEDRALVVAYWLQEVREDKQPTFNGQQVNTELKHLGHGTDDITDLIAKLVSTSPQQVLQTRKSGTSRQARKTYKITRAGIKRVQELLDASAG